MASADRMQDRAQRLKALQATLLLRIFAVIVVWMTLPVRDDLPKAMLEDYGLFILPLLAANLGLLLLSKTLSRFLFKYPVWLCVDVAIAVWILFLGGGWRSSYFEYTLTAVIIATIIARKKGAFYASAVLAVAGALKNPYPTGDPVIAFQVGSWDMRLGASLFYVTAGLILGYFSSLLDKISKLYEERVNEAARRAAVEEKMALALNLHDRLKSKLVAIVWMFKSITRSNEDGNRPSKQELVRLWYWLNYLQKELSCIVNSLRATHPSEALNSSVFSIHDLVCEEVRIINEITGFDWEIDLNRSDAQIPAATQRMLSGFLSEALTNAFKHSGKTRGRIQIGGEDSHVCIEIQDQGKGFYPEQTDPEATAGLENLKQRARELSGKLILESAPESGCCLKLQFPLPAIAN